MRSGPSIAADTLTRTAVCILKGGDTWYWFGEYRPKDAVHGRRFACRREGPFDLESDWARGSLRRPEFTRALGTPADAEYPSCGLR